MKKLFITTLLLITSVAVAEMAIDQKTNRYYSKNAPNNVDQQEYHILTNIFFERTVSRYWGLMHVPNAELALVFAMLRSNGSPTALRLIYDIEIIIKTAKIELQRLDNL